MVLLTLGSSRTYADQTAPEAFDFSVERSIWGSGPVRNIEPEIRPTTVTTETRTYGDTVIVTPFEKFDLSDLAADQEKRRQELAKQLMKERKVKSPVPLLNEDAHSHLGVGLYGGMSNLIIDSPFGTTSGSFTPGFIVDYYYFFNKNWGARVGLGLSYSRCNFSSNGEFRDSSNYVDFEGDSVALGYKVGEIDEDFKTIMLELPIMAAYNYKDWAFSAGFKFGFPLSIKYDQTMKDVDITGYYNFTDPIYSAKALGAMQDQNLRKKGKFSETPVYIMAGVSVGRKFRLTDKYDIGVSAFADYSLNSLQMRSRNDKANYQNSSDEYYLIRNEELTDERILTREDPGAKTNTASTLCSKRAVDGKRVIRDINYFNAGLKVSFYFSTYGNGTDEAKKEVERKAALLQ